jgi:hypothetical protein
MTAILIRRKLTISKLKKHGQRLANLLTKYAPRGIRNQGRPLNSLQEE